MPAVLPRRQSGAHRTVCAPSAAVPPTNLAAFKVLAGATAELQLQAERTILDEHENVLGYCVMCRIPWPCEVVLAQLSTNGLAS